MIADYDFVLIARYRTPVFPPLGAAGVSHRRALP